MSESIPWISLHAAEMATLRQICLDYPNSAEVITFDTPTFKVEKKIFVLAARRNGEVTISCKAAPGVQGVLVGADPDRYFVPPYFGPKGWIAAWLSPSRTPDWPMIEDLIDESYRLVAPKRLVRLLDPSDSSRHP